MTQIQDASSKDAFTYDNANRVLTVDDNGTTGLPQVTLTYGYDAASNRTSLDDSKGGLTSYTYDARNEVVSITQSGTSISSKRADFAYDNAGRMTTITRYSDLTGTTKVQTSVFGYDAGNRMTTITDSTSGGTTRVQYVYTYDAADRVTQEARTWASGSSTDTVTYGYTNNDQLTSVSHTNGSFSAETFSYDTNGNRNSSGYSTGTDNRISTDGTYNYTFDNEGNETLRTKISDGSQTIYKYDYRNRLVEVDSKVSGVTTVLAAFSYDALDRRIIRTEGGVTTATIYDGFSPIMDYTGGSTTPTTRYLQSLGAAVDEVLARDKVGIVAWYLPDRLGTVRDLIDNSGAIIDHVDYGAYGNQLAESTPANGDRLVGFAELERDTATGLNLAVNRVQDPITGRWLSSDPVDFAGGDPNLDRYVGNSPTDYVDPSGLILEPSPESDGGSLGGTILDWTVGWFIPINDLLASGENFNENWYRNSDPNYDPLDPSHGPLAAGSQYPGGNPLTPGMSGSLQGAAEVCGSATTPFRPQLTGPRPRPQLPGPKPRPALPRPSNFKTTGAQLQKKFKHAPAFGITGPANGGTLKAFENALRDHVECSATQRIVGSYHKNPVITYINKNTGLTVLTDPLGNFISGWKSSPQQIHYAVTTGIIGGG